MEVSGHCHALDTVPLGRKSLYRRLGGPQVQCGQVQKILPPSGFDPQTVQLVASCYTSYTVWLT